MKQFLIVGNINVITYKEVFPYIKTGEIKYRPQCIHREWWRFFIFLRKSTMDKLNDILTKLSATLQMVVGTLINLCFQPLFAITAIIDGTIEIWSPEPTPEPETVNTNVYPEPAHIKGFQTNQSEVDQIEQIKRQLNGE